MIHVCIVVDNIVILHYMVNGFCQLNGFCQPYIMYMYIEISRISLVVVTIITCKSCTMYMYFY